MKNIVVMLSLFSALGCSSNNGVFFKEMSNPPKITIQDNNKINIELQNSIVNSAKSIYRIHYQFDGDSLFLSATQKLSNLPLLKYQNSITINLNKEKVKKKINHIHYYWIDPDEVKTEIKL